MNLVNLREPWSKKSKSPVVRPKKSIEHRHIWVKIMSEYQFCLECSSFKRYNIEEFEIPDLSFYFEMDMSKEFDENLKKRIDTVNSTFQFLKERNPDSSMEELVEILEKHFRQMDNEKKYYRLERKIAKKRTH